MNQRKITKLMLVFVLLVAIFTTGLYMGRSGRQGDFVVSTQHGVGPLEEFVFAAIQEQVAQDAQNQTAPVQVPPEDAQADPDPSAQEEDVGQADAADKQININVAQVEELVELPGIGPVIAQRIIDHREEYGPFRIIEEITDVSGIGEQRFADIWHMITVE